MGENVEYASLAVKLPAPYIERLRQVALHLGLPTAGLLREALAVFVKSRSDLPTGLGEDLVRLGYQVNTRAPRRITPYIAPVAASAPASVEG